MALTKAHTDLLALKAERSSLLCTQVIHQKYMTQAQSQTNALHLKALAVEIATAAAGCQHRWSEDGSKCTVCCTEAVPPAVIDLSSE